MVKTPLDASGSSENCESCGAPFQSWGGWGDLFNCIISLKDWSQFAKQSAESIVNTFSQLQSRQRRIPTSDGRSRARRRRGLIRDMLRGHIECSLRWLQTGCPRLWEAPIGRSLRQLASRAAKEACCTSPLEFSGDKRGRLREVLANIVNRLPLSVNFGSLQFRPAQWSDDGSARRSAGALRIRSARIALPDPACVLSLEDWLPRSIAQSFNSPSLFNVSMHQWRSVVQRMVRCNLAVALPRDTCPVQLSGGAFAVPKTTLATASSVIAGLKTVKSLR